jgi:zinc and cadmium transporter
MGVLLHAGLGRRRALWYNFLCALAAVVGAVATLAFGSGGEALVDPLIPFTAGGFLYIAGSDLIPELKRETGARRSAAQLVCMALGIAVMWALTWVEV